MKRRVEALSPHHKEGPEIGSRVRLVLTALFALAPLGCGFTASPADDLRFEPPPGWAASPGILGFMQFWRGPGNDREVLMLIKSPGKTNARDVFSESDLHDTVHNLDIDTRKEVKLCGTQPAIYIEAHGTSSRGESVTVDATVADIRGSTYLGLYMRPLGQGANVAAMWALHRLCPKS